MGKTIVILKHARLSVLSMLLLATAAHAQDTTSPVIQNRITNFRDMGSSFKNIQDELKIGHPDVSKIRASANIIEGYSKHLPEWFPKGSEPPPKPKLSFFEWLESWWSPSPTDASINLFVSHAKPEIWSNPAGFRSAALQFQREAFRMTQITQKGDIKAIQVEFRNLGASCNACHKDFREKLH